MYDLSAIEAVPDDWPDESLIRALKVLCLDHYNVAAQLRAATICREEGIPIVADLEVTDVESFDDLLAAVDHLILSREVASTVTASASPEAAFLLVA